MTRAPASAPEHLFDAIAKLLEPGQREYFYQRMLYFRHLRPDDELLRIVEAIGFLFSSAPFLVPAQPSPDTVDTEWPASAAIRSYGRFSSSSTRTCQQALARELKGRDGLFASNRRELLEKLVQGIAGFEVVEKRLHWDASANEHRRSTQNLEVAVHNSCLVRHPWTPV